MNVTMGQLVNDAKELVLRLKEREKNIDQVVIRSNALAKQVDANQQLENELININERANHRSKVAVLSSIQKENKVIKLLQQENEDLKESLEEHQSVLEIIMSKYRQQMLKLIKLKKEQELTEQYYKSKVFQSLQEKTDQIAEMTEVMKKAIELDEKQLFENEERLQMLLVENRGLKDLLKIRNKYGAQDHSSESSNPTAHKSNLVDKEIQTDDDFLKQNTSINSNNTPITTPSPTTTTATTTSPNENYIKKTEVIVPFQLDDNITSVSQSNDEDDVEDDENVKIKDSYESSNANVSLNDSSLEAAAAAVESVVEQIEADQHQQS